MAEERYSLADVARRAEEIQDEMDRPLRDCRAELAAARQRIAELEDQSIRGITLRWHGRWQWIIYSPRRSISGSEERLSDAMETALGIAEAHGLR